MPLVENVLPWLMTIWDSPTTISNRILFSWNRKESVRLRIMCEIFFVSSIWGLLSRRQTVLHKKWHICIENVVPIEKGINSRQQLSFLNNFMNNLEWICSNSAPKLASWGRNLIKCIHNMKFYWNKVGVKK